MNDQDVRLVYVVCGSEDEALSISRALVEEGLAACTNLWPIRSVYVWEGELQEEAEVALLIKTVEPRVPDVEERVRQLHSYELPCILALEPGYVEQGYGQWIAAGSGGRSG